MTNTKFTTPLSPPSSPRMSDVPLKGESDLWHASLRDTPTYPHSNGRLSSVAGERPHLVFHGTQLSAQNQSDSAGHGGAHQRYQSQSGSRLSDLSRSPSNDSTTRLCSHHAMHQSPDFAPGDASPPENEDMEYDDIALGSVDGDANATDEAEPPMTAAEIRSAKRKMKRFRLTHQQTRFLMNEFARQAHPDAAHRQRLSREIPGLSPRQVQVWFQNRRAKLKRLTADDRDRMTRSRTLPSDFDPSHALNAPFGPSAMRVTLPSTDVGSYGSEHPIIARSGALDGVQQTPGYGLYGHGLDEHVGNSRGLPNYTYGSMPHSVTSVVPATTPTTMMMMSNYGGSAQDELLQENAYLGQLESEPTQYSSYPALVHSDQQERYPRLARAGPSIPSRSGVSYNNVTTSHSTLQQASFGERVMPPERNMANESHSLPLLHSAAAAYNLGLSYPGVTSYQSDATMQHGHARLSQMTLGTHAVESRYAQESRAGDQMLPEHGNPSFRPFSTPPIGPTHPNQGRLNLSKGPAGRSPHAVQYGSVTSLHEEEAHTET